MKINASIEKGNDGYYSISTESEIETHGIGGFGESVEIAKNDFMESIEEAKEMVKKVLGYLPIQYESIQIDFK